MIQSSWKVPVTPRLFVDTSFMWFDNYFTQKETAPGLRIRAMLDVASLTNASTVLLQNNTYGANWQRPSYILRGRLFKPSVELTF